MAHTTDNIRMAVPTSSDIQTRRCVASALDLRVGAGLWNTDVVALVIKVSPVDSTEHSWFRDCAVCERHPCASRGNADLGAAMARNADDSRDARSGSDLHGLIPFCPSLGTGWTP
jgi:hypothetical protein